MRRIVLSLIALLLTAYAFAGGPARMGVIAGLTSSQTSIKDIDASQAGFHAGLTANLPLFLGFSLQPSVIYQQKGTQYELLSSSASSKMGYIEVPLQLQFGIDLVLLRPYVFAEPFVGYAVSNNVKASSSLEDVSLNGTWDNVNRFEYGLGLGGGLDLGGKAQISLKYFWNFDDSSIDKNIEQIASSWWSSAKSSISEKKTFNGLAVSLALFF